MKFGQLIEYKMGIFFLKNHTQNGEASTRPFYRKIKIEQSLDQQSEMLQSLFLLYIQVKVYQLTIYFSCYNLKNDQISLPDCLYFFIYWLVCVM